MTVPELDTEYSFKVGLCLAGAATGGAYSAGVMDFLLEAMAEWDRLKQRSPWSVPTWSVQIAEMAGTSAGGITATLAAASLNINHEPLPRGYKLGEPAPKNNPLFQTWVKEMDYSRLFDCRDIDDKDLTKARVRSILYANFMAETSEKVLQPDKIHKTLPDWAAGMRLLLTATNMRGVPYSINDFTTYSQGVARENAKFYMRRYADYTTFQLTTCPESVPAEWRKSMHILNIAEPRSSEGWQRAITCSRATSAFPAGFPTVNIETPKSFYENRLRSPPDCISDAAKIDNHDDEHDPIHRYAAVDGGALNNEPFGLLEDEMEGRYGKKFEENGTEWGSLIMIDPFPGEDLDPKVVGDGLPLAQTLRAIISSIRGEAMFKENEVRAAVQENSMAKFMIRPDRDHIPKNGFALATATLHSFGGMLDEKIRLHDFQLGRHNCKVFLEKVFCIRRQDALKNPIFATHRDHPTQDRVPIIPIEGKASEPIPAPKWPTFSAKEREEIVRNVLGVIKERILKSMNIFFAHNNIIKPAFCCDLRQWVMNQAGKAIRNRLFKRVIGSVEDALHHAMDSYKERKVLRSYVGYENFLSVPVIMQAWAIAIPTAPTRNWSLTDE